MNKRWIVVSALFLAAACATVTTDTVFAIDVDSDDDPSSESIRLSYENKTARTICLTPANWPNKAGKINQASDRVWLTVSGERFEINDFNTGYCVGGCATSVGPNERISASVPYSEFDLPANLTKDSKVLHFQPTAFYCDPKS